MFHVQDRRAIVTGSAQGIGKALAKVLLQKGCKVCISDLDEKKGLETKIEFQKHFELTETDVCFVKCDVTASEDWEYLWNSAESKLNGKIDILINNAGIFPAVSIFQIDTRQC